MTQRFYKTLHRHGSLIFVAALLFVIASLAAVVLIDGFNVSDLRTRHFADADFPFFWYHWFDSPVENPLQWLFLGATAAVCALNTWAGRDGPDDTRRFWGLMTIGILLMLAEDALNIRHIIHGLIVKFTDHASYGVLTTMVELAFFASLAAVLLTAFFRYRQVFWKHAKTRWYLVVGFAMYAIAVGSSWLGSAFGSLVGGNNLYAVAGRLITDPLFMNDEETARLFTETSDALVDAGLPPLEFWFMDRVFEESVELLGAAALLVAALTFFARTASTDQPKRSSS